MYIGSVGSTYGNVRPQAAQPKAEAAEVRSAGGDRDGDSDDGGRNAVSSPKPTVNLSGQKIGQVINAVA
jgi:hypothetical protein